MNHPSFLVLDRHALAPAPGEIATHLEGCPQCAAHVCLVQRAEPPAFELKGPRTAPRRLGPPFALALVACAAVLLAVVLPRLHLGGETITPKGAAPAALLWVNRGGAVHVWQQGEKLRAGESVRFEIAPAGYSHLVVVDVSSAPRILYEVSLSDASLTLSPAWKLEPTSARDELAVILSRGPLSEGELPGLLCQQTPRAWCTRFTLEQEP